MSFKDFNLLPELLRALTDKGYVEPTTIQRQAIPIVLAGGDLMGGSQTGTGKTAGFTLPILHNLMKRHGGKGAVRALILTPTRELAAQVEESVRVYGKYLPLRSTALFGGVNIGPQIGKLRRGVDIVVATPGRLLDLVNQRAVDLSQVEVVVLDEADRMLDMGFIVDIRKILALLPKKRQSLLFSATFSFEVKKLADDLLTAPKLVEVERESLTASKVSQVIHPVDNSRKRELLSHLIRSQEWKQVLVFTRTKHGANKLSTQLEDDGISTVAIHGNKTQGQRSKALADFKKGKVQVMVATDIAARGLDIDHLPHVVNYDLPMMAEDYVHRIGRTGRAGREGCAVSLVSIDEHKLLRGIERLLKRKIDQEVVPSYEPDPSIKPEPIFTRRAAPSNRGGGPGRPKSGAPQRGGRSSYPSKSGGGHHRRGGSR